MMARCRLLLFPHFVQFAVDFPVCADNCKQHGADLRDPHGEPGVWKAESDFQQRKAGQQQNDLPDRRADHVDRAVAKARSAQPQDHGHGGQSKGDANDADGRHTHFVLFLLHISFPLIPCRCAGSRSGTG